MTPDPSSAEVAQARESAHVLRAHPYADYAAHVVMINDLAERAGKPGNLVVCRFGEDPLTGRKTSPLVRHFAIGDVEGMAAAVRQLGAERNRNVYIPLA